MKKKLDKNVKKSVENSKEQAMKSLKIAGEELINLVNMAKKQYKESDEKTKNKIITGIVGASAIVTAAIGIKKILEKKKK